MQRPQVLIVIAFRRIGDKEVLDCHVFDLMKKEERHAALGCVLSLLALGFSILIFAR